MIRLEWPVKGQASSLFATVTLLDPNPNPTSPISPVSFYLLSVSLSLSLSLVVASGRIEYLVI